MTTSLSKEFSKEYDISPYVNNEEDAGNYVGGESSIVDELIKLSEFANIPLKLNVDFSHIKKILIDHEENHSKVIPKGDFEHIINHILKLVKKSEIIPIELPSVEPQLKEILDSQLSSESTLMKQINEMRIDSKYNRYNNVLDIAGLITLYMEADEPYTGKYGGYPLDTVLGSIKEWGLWSIYRLFILMIGAYMASVIRHHLKGKLAEYSHGEYIMSLVVILSKTLLRVAATTFSYMSTLSNGSVYAYKGGKLIKTADINIPAEIDVNNDRYDPYELYMASGGDSSSNSLDDIDVKCQLGLLISLSIVIIILILLVVYYIHSIINNYGGNSYSAYHAIN